MTLGVTALDLRLFNVFKSNNHSGFFYEHSFSFVVSILISIKLMETIWAMRKEKEKRLYTYVIVIFAFQALSYAFLFIAQSSKFPLLIMFWVMFNAIFKNFMERCRVFYNSINHYIDAYSLANLEKNLKQHGYNAIELIAQDNKLNFAITCNEATFVNIHSIVALYSRNDYSAVFLIDFLLKKKITIDKQYNFVNENGGIIDSKQFLKTYYEYVRDYKDQHSVNDFFQETKGHE